MTHLVLAGCYSGLDDCRTPTPPDYVLYRFYPQNVVHLFWLTRLTTLQQKRVVCCIYYLGREQSGVTFIFTMAFEVPIEADHPSNDTGFISSLIRAPISGLMWILGMKTEDSPVQVSSMDETLNSSTSTKDEDIICNFSEWHKSQEIILDRPGAVSSDTSEASDYTEDVTITAEKHCENNDNYIKTMQTSSRIAQTNISWSDELGNSLVFYCDESGRDLHEPPQLSNESAGPIKSAMKRSKSININSVNRTLAVVNEHVSVFRSCGTHNPVSSQIPGFGKSSSALAGTVSPQWGWYTTGSTTPPSPELFAHSGHQICSVPSTQDASSRHMHLGSLSQSAGLSSAAFVNMDRRKAGPSHPNPLSQPRPTFNKNSIGMPNNRGWPSVPI